MYHLLLESFTILIQESERLTEVYEQIYLIFLHTKTTNIYLSRIQQMHLYRKGIKKGGVLSHMKNMISLHRGLSKSLKLNLVDYYLVNYKKK